jgi:hypothetical protein
MSKNMRVILATAAGLAVVVLVYTLVNGWSSGSANAAGPAASSQTAPHSVSGEAPVPVETAGRTGGSGGDSGSARLEAPAAEPETVEETADGTVPEKKASGQRRTPKRRPKAGKQEQGFEEDPQPEKKKVQVAR